MSRHLDLDARDARIAVAVGMAAGIGAIFRAPLGGAILGAELLYRDDIESDALFPSFIATIVAYSIVGAVVGGYIATAIFHKGDVTGVNVESIVIAVLGAILVLFVWRALTRNRASM